MSSQPAAPGPAPRERSRVSGYVIGNWVALALAVLAVVFIAQNRDEVSVDLLWISLTSPLWLVLALMFLVGWVAAKLGRGGRGTRTHTTPTA